MPLYEFECPKCSASRDVIRKVNDDTDVVCNCGSKMQKQFSRPAYKFANGTGTDLGNLMSVPSSTNRKSQ